MKRKLSFLAVALLIGCSAAFSAAVTWTGGAAGDWSVASNWSTAAVPGTADDVTIQLGYTVTISSPVSNINSLSVSGVLNIAAGGSLTVNQTTSVNPIVQILGGEIRNSGTFTITNTLTNANRLLRYDSTPNGDGIFENLGTFTLNNVNGTGEAIYFNQTSSGKAAQFIAGGAINTNIKAQNRLFSLEAGSAVIDGTGSFGSASNYLDLRFIHVGGAGAVNLSIPSSANISFYSKYSPPSLSGTIASNNTGNANINVAGVLNINGNGTTENGIYLNPQASAVTTLTNTGTINVNGTFPQGGIYITGATTATSAYINNESTGNLNVNITSGGSALKVISGKTGTINNNGGKITLATASSSSISVGDNTTKVNNTGTITVNRNLASNTGGTVAGIINNNFGGIFDFNVADNAAQATNSNKVMFNNNGGTLIGRGSFSGGSFTPSTGTVSPGNTTNPIGIFTFTDGFLDLTGNVTLEANGKTTAGTDFDQINSTGQLQITNATLNFTTGGSYTPANGDMIPLVSAAPRLGNFVSTTLPTNWAMDYATPALANAIYSIGTSVSQNKFTNSISTVGKTIIIDTDSKENLQMDIINFEGRKLQSYTLKNGLNEIQTGLQQGFYIIRLNGVSSEKILIK